MTSDLTGIYTPFGNPQRKCWWGRLEPFFMQKINIKEKNLSGCLRKDYNRIGKENQNIRTTAGILKVI